MQLRKFTDEGLAKFEAFLRPGESCENLSEEDRKIWLQDANFSSRVDDNILLNENEKFEIRQDAGMYLHEKLGHKSDTELKDKYLWAWLTLFFFPQVCRGKILKGLQYYVPDFSQPTRYYKHFLWGPFSICRQYHGDLEKARAVLCSPVSAGNDVIEQVASRQELISCSNVLEAASKLYVDPQTNRLKKGFTGRHGNVRRFGNVMMQFDMTYDLHQISADDLIRKLPQEFDRFKPPHLVEQN